MNLDNTLEAIVRDTSSNNSVERFIIFLASYTIWILLILLIVWILWCIVKNNSNNNNTTKIKTNVVTPKKTSVGRSTFNNPSSPQSVRIPPTTVPSQSVSKPPFINPQLIEKGPQYEIIDVGQRSSKWKELRAGKVTGTTAYYLKNNPVKYAIRKGIERDKSDYISEAMKRGRRLEPIGIKRFATEKNLNVETVGFIVSKTYKDAGFSPDGVIFGAGKKIETIIEHKAFNREHHYRCYNRIDDKVMFQIQFGMFITGAADAYLVLYNPDLVQDKLFRKRFNDYETQLGTLSYSSS